MPGSSIGVMPPAVFSPAEFPFTEPGSGEEASPQLVQAPQAPPKTSGKTSGLGDDFWAGGYHVGGDIRDVAVNGGPALLDVTDITQSAHSRLGGLRDGHMAVTSYMDPAAAQSHAAFSGLPTADVIMTYCRGQAIGNPAACLNAKQVNYDPTRANTGELTFKVQGDGNAYGLEWGLQLTAGLRTDTSATNGLSLDNAAGTSFGAQAYLQASAFTGTDVTVTVQHSADNATWATLVAFSQITGGTPSAQRVSVSNATTVNRYLRVITTTSGGFTSLAFQVTATRNSIASVVF